MRADPPRAVVVGSGVGGLLTSARLAAAGVHVSLVEQNSRSCAGGRLATETLFAQGRAFRFETGPSLLLLPNVYREALRSVGADETALRLARVRPSYAVHFADGLPSPLLLGGGPVEEEALRENMEAVEPGSYQQLRAYMRSARANLRAGLPIFISERFGPAELATLPPFLAGALLGGETLTRDGREIAWSKLLQGDGGKRKAVAPLVDWPLTSHGSQCARRFRAARHRALLSYQDLYIGLPPAEAPAVFSLLQAIELAETDAPAELNSCSGDDSGVWYPLGGFGTFRNLLLQACENAGVTFYFGARAREVCVTATEGGASRVTGLKIQRLPSIAEKSMSDKWGECGEPPGAAALVTDELGAAGSAEQWDLLPADCVIINADLAAAEPELLGRAGLARSQYDDISERKRDHSSEPRSDRVAMAAGGSGATEADGPQHGTGPASSRAWRYSSSTVTFLWCMDKRYDALRHHNVFLAPEEADPWRGLFDAVEFAQWGNSNAGAGSEPGRDLPFHFYLCAPARTDASVVQCDTDDALMVLVPTPPIDERFLREERAAELEATEARIVERARKGVISALEATAGCEGLSEHIVGEKVRTPRGWKAAYNLRRGSVFGLSHGLDQLSLLRPGRRHPGIRGLHYVGASTRPGNGVPLVLIGAEKTAEEALHDLGVTQRAAVAAKGS